MTFIDFNISTFRHASRTHHNPQAISIPFGIHFQDLVLYYGRSDGFALSGGTKTTISWVTSWQLSIYSLQTTHWDVQHQTTPPGMPFTGQYPTMTLGRKGRLQCPKTFGSRCSSLPPCTYYSPAPTSCIPCWPVEEDSPYQQSWLDISLGPPTYLSKALGFALWCSSVRWLEFPL